MRLVRIAGHDLNLFDFDYDVTWMAFFLNANEKVLGRYGGRDASGPDGRLSLPGLRYAMQAALDAHSGAPQARPAERPARPLLAEEYPVAKRLRRGECIHCHQVYELRRAAEKAAGSWDRDERWVYPLPENVGLTLAIERGDQVRAVTPGSPAARAGLNAGDVVQTVNGFTIASAADAQYALHRAPKQGRISISWRRGEKTDSGELELREGWRKTNVTWRPSMLDLLPSLPVHGDDLTRPEKLALGLTEKRLAFRQAKPVFTEARKAGLREDDVIVGVNDEAFEMTMLDFMAHVRRNYLVGDRITLNVLRDGKHQSLALQLR